LSSTSHLFLLFLHDALPISSFSSSTPRKSSIFCLFFTLINFLFSLSHFNSKLTHLTPLSISYNKKGTSNDVPLSKPIYFYFLVFPYYLFSFISLSFCIST